MYARQYTNYVPAHRCISATRQWRAAWNFKSRKLLFARTYRHYSIIVILLSKLDVYRTRKLLCFLIVWIHKEPGQHQPETSNENNFPLNWPFVRGIHRSPVDSSHKDQRREALMFSLICALTNGWSNNPDVGDLGRHCAHQDVTVMQFLQKYPILSIKMNTSRFLLSTFAKMRFYAHVAVSLHIPCYSRSLKSLMIISL